MPATRTADSSSTKCSTCGDTFADRSSLRRHTKLHAGVREYECAYCERTFTQSNQLKTHVASQHEHDKPYKCKYDACDKGFNDPSLRTRHYVRDHGAATKSRTLTARRRPRRTTRPASSPSTGEAADAIPFAFDDSELPSFFDEVSSLDAFFEDSIRSSPSASSPPFESFGAVETNISASYFLPTSGYPADVPAQPEFEFNNAALPPLGPATTQTFPPPTYSFPQQGAPLNVFPDLQSAFPQHPSFPATSYDLFQPAFETAPCFERTYGQTQVPLVQPSPESNFPVWYPMTSLYPQAQEPMPFVSAGLVDGSLDYLCQSQDNGSFAQETKHFPAAVDPALIFDQYFHSCTDAQTAHPFAYPSP